tara:strand:+ start:553 stop:840 length:288 start_codon:yes stop_codon:yes gene_type:complete
MDNFWSVGIAVFLCVLSFIKYTDAEQLKAWIEDFLSRISPLQVIEEEQVVELDEITDIISDFVIRNREIFSRIKVKDECAGQETISEEQECVDSE